MKLSIINTPECKKALRLVADPLTIQMFIALHESHTLRFNELKRVCSTNAVTLSKRLTDLEQAGLILRREKTASAQSVIYSLSELGESCMPIAEAVATVAMKLSSPKIDQ